MPRTPSSSVPNQVSEVEVELRRVVERWRQLPLDRALWYSGRVRTLVQALADEVAEVNGTPASAVPDLGPATLMDQLTVLVHDASAAALTLPDTPPALMPPAQVLTSRAVTSTLAEDLAGLRRELR